MKSQFLVLFAFLEAFFDFSLTTLHHHILMGWEAHPIDVYLPASVKCLELLIFLLELENCKAESNWERPEWILQTFAFMERALELFCL